MAAAGWAEVEAGLLSMESWVLANSVANSATGAGEATSAAASALILCTRVWRGVTDDRRERETKIGNRIRLGKVAEQASCSAIDRHHE